MVAYTFTSLLFPMFVSLIVDNGIIKRSIKSVVVYSISMLIVGVGIILFQYLQENSIFQFAQRIVINIRENIYNKLVKTNCSFWEEHKVGDVFTILMQDVERIEGLITSSINSIIINILVICGISIYLLYIDITIGMLVLILAVLFAFIQKKIGNIIEKKMVSLRNEICDLTAFTDETLNNMNNIQACGYEKIAKKKYIEKNNKVKKQTILQMKVIIIGRIIGIVFNIIILSFILSLGAFKVYHNYFSVGVLFSLTIYVQRLYGPIIGLGNSYISIRNSIPIIDRILNIIETNDIIIDGKISLNKNLKGEIWFKNVSFSYKSMTDKKVLDNFNLKIKPGEIIGIVGENGTGKSTIIKLLMGLCNPDCGEILLDNICIFNYNTKYLREQIGYMPQESFLFSGKLDEILFLEQDNTNQKKLQELLNKFDLTDKIINKTINENKSNISGGEVQKISLVRLFLQSKPIYIMDEPTAAMDIQAEIKICTELKKLLKNKTAIIISHRPEILKICDRIIDMSKLTL